MDYGSSRILFIHYIVYTFLRYNNGYNNVNIMLSIISEAIVVKFFYRYNNYLLY